MPPNAISGRFAPLMIGQMDGRLWGPVVTASIIDPLWDRKGMPRTVADGLVALVDTGAQNSAVDEALAERLFLTRTRQDSVNLLGQSTPAQGHEVGISFPGFGKVYVVEIPARPFRLGNAAFDLVLGWDILRHFSLALSRHPEDVTLRRVEPERIP